MKIQISDVQLPEKLTENILAILESNNMPARVPDKERGVFNCWGFTAWYLQWETEALWLEGWKMESHLKMHTYPISKEDAKAGDIAVFRRGDFLTHTAVILPGGDVVCHKPGGTPLCIDTIKSASTSYGEVSYAREIKNEKTV